MRSHDQAPVQQCFNIPWVYTIMLALLAVIVPGLGCEKSKKRPTQAEICRRGCAYRLACIEDLALEKAVTDANREHLRHEQRRNRQKYLEFCVKACRSGKPRFRAYARCGTSEKTCKAYFRCESDSIRRLKGKRTP